MRDAYEARWTHLLSDLNLVDQPGLHRLTLFGAMNSSVEWFDTERGTSTNSPRSSPHSSGDERHEAHRISIDTGSAAYAENQAAYEAMVATLANANRSPSTAATDGSASIERHLSRGKVLVRDRIDMVTDHESAFLEFSTLSGFGQYDDEVPGGGIVTGIGIVHGVPWVFIANDATVKGGSLVPVAIKKHVRAQEIAEENGLGVIYLVDSGGAFLPLQDEIFPDKDHFGGSFYRQARLSAKGLPQLSVVLGGCTAGGAYVPALSDEVIMVEGIGRIFLGGPPIVKAALGEIIEPDDLGGAELHTRLSGVSDYMAATEAEAYGKLREICATTNQRRVDAPRDWMDITETEPPAYAADELYGIVSADDRIPFDATEIIARIVDGSKFSRSSPNGASRSSRFRPHPWPHGRHHRQQRHHLQRVGLKATHFIELCEQRRIPLLFLQNTSGYMVGHTRRSAASPRTGRRWSRPSPTPPSRSTRC